MDLAKHLGNLLNLLSTILNDRRELSSDIKKRLKKVLDLLVKAEKAAREARRRVPEWQGA